MTAKISFNVICLGIVNFNHANGCQKCVVCGEFDKTSRRMSFPVIDAERRTNHTFRSRSQIQHHKEYSLFEDLPIDMINTFPTSDPLHLLHLGVMKKCISRWIYGDKRYMGKWSKALTEQMSILLTDCNSNMPSDIHRSIRSLKVLKYWKGVEFRTFLLYLGMVVLKEALNENEYFHFLTLSCAVRLCSSNVYKKYLKIASKMFCDYVKGYIDIYGRDTISSNVHNLIHICEDMEQLGAEDLDKLSTYRYENSLRMLGLKIKHCNLPLEQTARRMIEEFEATKSCDLGIRQFIPYAQSEIQLDDMKGYEKIFIKPDIMLSVKKTGDQWFLTKSNEIVKMKCAIKIGNVFKIVGNKLISKTDFFTFPLSSSILNIYSSNGYVDVDNQIQFDLSQIQAKMICLKSQQNIVLMPILHSLEILNE